MVLPALHQAPALGGEIVLMDRSWYNRAGVERVMGYCAPRHSSFLNLCAKFPTWSVCW